MIKKMRCSHPLDEIYEYRLLKQISEEIEKSKIVDILDKVPNDQFPVTLGLYTINKVKHQEE